MGLKESWPYYIAVAGLILFNLSLLAPPFLIFSGYEGTADFLYKIHSYDHQWIYRSQCIFKDANGNLLPDDCIWHGKEAEASISTLYTKNGDPGYNGIFTTYAQNQIGINKAERVERNGMVGYKFANDTRDYSIYIPLTVTLMAYPFVFGPGRRKAPAALWLLLALVPLGIDGTFQLFGFWESTNLMRMITGGIAGIGMGIFAAPLLNSFGGRPDDAKATAKMDGLGKTSPLCREKTAHRSFQQGGHMIGEYIRRLSGALSDRRTQAKTLLYGIGVFLLLGIVAALLPNPIFTRMTGSAPLDYLFLLSTAFLGGLYLAVPGSCSQDTEAATGGFFGVLAFSCALCNQLLLALLGAALLLDYFEPLRPFLGIVSVAMLLYAIDKKMVGTPACASLRSQKRNANELKHGLDGGIVNGRDEP